MLRLRQQQPDGPCKIVNEHGVLVSTTDPANAALIVTAVNAYEPLVKALKDARAMLARVEVVDREPGDPWSEAIARIDAALAIVKGIGDVG